MNAGVVKLSYVTPEYPALPLQPWAPVTICLSVLLMRYLFCVWTYPLLLLTFLCIGTYSLFTWTLNAASSRSLSANINFYTNIHSSSTKIFQGATVLVLAPRIAIQICQSLCYVLHNRKMRPLKTITSVLQNGLTCLVLNYVLFWGPTAN